MSGTSFTITDSVDSKTIAQWTQDWWTWALQAPAHQNAIDDRTGQYASIGNNDPSVFFIAGTNGGDAERTFSVPAGKALLIPMVNFFDTEDPKPLENQLVQQFNKSVSLDSLSASIDNQPIPDLSSHLVISDFFDAGELQNGTYASELFGRKVVGTEMTPTKSTGYWLLVEGLPVGQHTVQFGGSTSNFQNNVVDHITVVA